MATTLFKYFDVTASGEGSGDFRLTFDEMASGMNGIGDMVEQFAGEFNFWWAFFDLDGSGCVTLPEFEEGLENQIDIVNREWTITTYWINYYWTTYQITEYWWWKCHAANGGFDWHCYATRVPDGPAFDGKPMLFQTGDGDVTSAYIWWRNDVCHFSLDKFDEEQTDAGRSGSCTIPGHKAIGFDEDLSEVKLNFKNNPEHAVDMIYQFGEWGPTGEHTDLRFYTGYMQSCSEFGLCTELPGSWLWERTDEYCAVCEQTDQGYPSTDYWGEGSEYTYYDSYYSEPHYPPYATQNTTITVLDNYEIGSDTITGSDTVIIETDPEGNVTETVVDDETAEEELAPYED